MNLRLRDRQATKLKNDLTSDTPTTPGKSQNIGLNGHLPGVKKKKANNNATLKQFTVLGKQEDLGRRNEEWTHFRAGN